MIYYKRHLGDYVKATVHLSMLEDGAYTRLLDWYYSQERPIPADKCERIARASNSHERNAVRAVLHEFFQETLDGFRHRRADAVIHEAKERAKKASKSAKARWDAEELMRTHSERTANASENACETDAKSMLSTIHYPEEEQEQHQEHVQPTVALAPNAAHRNVITPDVPPTNPDSPPTQSAPYVTAKSKSKRQKQPSQATAFCPPDWVPIDDWLAYVEMRKHKRAAPTVRACELVLTELERLRTRGHDPGEVIRQSIRNGWTDVYPIKDLHYANRTASRNLSAVERVEHAIAENDRRAATVATIDAE